MHYKLKDDWMREGTSYEEFKEVIAEIDEATHYKDVMGDHVDYYFSVNGPFEKNGEEAWRIQRVAYDNLVKNLDFLANGYYTHADFLVASRNNLMETKLLRPHSPKHAKILDPELLKESLAGPGFIMRIGDPVLLDDQGTYEVQNPHLYYMSDTGKGLLCSRLDIKGQSTLQKDLYLTYHICNMYGTMGHNKKPLKIMYREVKNPNGYPQSLRKIFGFFTPSYVPIRQSVLTETVDAITAEGLLGKTEVKSWHIDQNFTRIYLEFPDAADDFQKAYKLNDRVVPGVLLCSSDTGASSVIIRGTYRVEGKSNYVVCEEYAHRHLGNITAEQVLKEADEQVLKQLRRLPEALAQKIGVRIGNADLTTARGVSQNRQMVGDAIKRAYRKLGLHKVLGKKRSDNLVPQMQECIDPNCVYTEYDIAMMFMTLSDSIASIPDSLRIEISKACGNAPFIDYEYKTGRKKRKTEVQEEEEDNLILLPQAM